MSDQEAFLARVLSLIPEAEGPFIRLLERRLLALEDAAGGKGPFPDELRTPECRDIALGVLGPLEGSWDEGDEDLVRGTLDGWGGGGFEEAARRLVGMAGELGRIRCRRGTVAFFLWEMESLVRGGPP